MSSDSHQCPHAPDISELASSISILIQKIDMQIVMQRDVIRWLLVVVCVIALGRSALDLGKDFFKGGVVSTHAEASE